MTATKRPRGEMPFLDHLEELRWRILWSLLAVVLGTVIGFVVVQHFDVLALLKRPIVPFLPEDKLFITRPTDAFMITLKLALFVGVVLAAPVVIYQAWAFLSPALYDEEKKYAVPALLAGLGLFLLGAVLAYLWVLPASLRILFSFQRADLEPIIVAGEYFTFAAQLILAFALVFELPLVIVLLSATGLVSPAFFQRNRPVALVIAAGIAAFLTPPDALSMMLMLAPIVLLYETGIAIGRLVWRRRSAATIGATILVLGLVGGATPVAAQQEERGKRPDSVRVNLDSLRAQRGTGGQPLDTAVARRLGLPTGPSRSFPAPDSVLQALLRLEGFRVIRYAADSMVLYADTQAVELMGTALVEQEGATLEAEHVFFRQQACALRAGGDPTLFQEGTVLVGERMRYDTCERRGFVDGAITNFEQMGTEWFMRGGLSVDSASVRMYAKRSAITSCELPDAHYHFGAGEVKWVSNTYLVARPAVLYVRDIPVLWLPFIFQDTRPGRRSGLLVPRLGLSDIVRPNPGYRRHVANVGYYFAINDYLDARFGLDWFAGNYVALNGQLRYRWLNRFLSGGLSLTRQWEAERGGVPGGRSLRLQWQHRQQFNYRTSLNASVDFATQASVVQRNAVDPFLATATLASNITFNRQWDWGTLSLGGSRRQDLTTGTVTQTLPTFSLTPAPVDILPDVTWQPSVTFSNDRTIDQVGPLIEGVPLPGDTALPRDTLRFDSRRTRIGVQTPLRIGRWNWTNSISLSDFVQEQRTTRATVDSVTGDTTRTVFGLDFASELDWNTGINLPLVFASSWKLQPRLGVQNTTGGAFLVRNRNTQGRWVSQGKRLSFGAGLRPTLFGFFPGLGPLSRIRHSISPLVDWAYAPAATIPEDYLRAIDPTGQRSRESPAQHRISLSFSQTFEGKLRPPPDDTTTDPRDARKIKLLQIQTSQITYDFEQAKEEGRTGWQTDNLSNQFTSDLLPGFSLATTHSLWRGAVGTDTAAFEPFLTRLSARFSITQRTLAGLVGLFTGRTPEAAPAADTAADTLAAEPDILSPGMDPGRDFDRRGDSRRARSRGFSASISFDAQRRRPVDGEERREGVGPQRDTRTLGLSLSFEPTDNWSLSWATQYNLTTNEFGSHTLRLERDLHRWRATFQFLQAPNGNFAFNFFISLLDQPDIRFQYDQQTVR